MAILFFTLVLLFSIISYPVISFTFVLLLSALLSWVIVSYEAVKDWFFHTLLMLTDNCYHVCSGHKGKEVVLSLKSDGTLGDFQYPHHDKNSYEGDHYDILKGCKDDIHYIKPDKDFLKRALGPYSQFI